MYARHVADSRLSVWRGAVCEPRESGRILRRSGAEEAHNLKEWGESMPKRYLGALVGSALSLGFAALAAPAAAVQVDLPIMADTLLAGHSSEKDLNCGGR